MHYTGRCRPKHGFPAAKQPYSTHAWYAAEPTPPRNPSPSPAGHTVTTVKCCRNTSYLSSKQRAKFDSHSAQHSADSEPAAVCSVFHVQSSVHHGCRGAYTSCLPTHGGAVFGKRHHRAGDRWPQGTVACPRAARPSPAARPPSFPVHPRPCSGQHAPRYQGAGLPRRPVSADHVCACSASDGRWQPCSNAWRKKERSRNQRVQRQLEQAAHERKQETERQRQQAAQAAERQLEHNRTEQKKL